MSSNLLEAPLASKSTGVRLSPQTRTSSCIKLLTYVRYGYSVGNVAKHITNTPLTPAVLHILLALSTEERHGYGIMKEVESDSQGKVKMGPGTLYGSLGRMMEAGLIRESDKKVDPELDDERRVYYKITGLGQAALAAELERYREVVAVGKKKQLARCFRLWHLNLSYDDTETGTQNCFASIRSRTASALAKAWNKLSTTSAASA